LILLSESRCTSVIFTSLIKVIKCLMKKSLPLNPMQSWSIFISPESELPSVSKMYTIDNIDRIKSLQNYPKMIFFTDRYGYSNTG